MQASKPRQFEKARTISFHEALMGKQLAKCHSQDSYVWVQLVKRKYKLPQHFSQSCISKGCSWTWRAVCKGEDVLNNGVKWAIGDGRRVNVLHDNWISNTSIAARPMPMNMTSLNENDTVPHLSQQVLEPSTHCRQVLH